MVGLGLGDAGDCVDGGCNGGRRRRKGCDLVRRICGLDWRRSCGNGIMIGRRQRSARPCTRLAAGCQGMVSVSWSAVWGVDWGGVVCDVGEERGMSVERERRLPFLLFFGIIVG